MTVDLRGRHFLRIADHTRDELGALLDLAAELKGAKRSATERPRLVGRNIALVFEKDSTRTRAAFEVAAFDQGAHVSFIGPSGSHIGRKETIRDTARVLGRLYDGIGYRGAAEAVVDELAASAGIPVWNGLTDESHPTQVLADLLTMREHCRKPLDAVSFAYLGDARNNVANSLLMGAAVMGMDVRLAAPADLMPPAALQARVRERAAASGASITITDDVAEAVSGADFVITDVWVSMGEPAEVWAERIALLEPYRVDSRVMKLTGNADARFMHCLPAFHDATTDVGRAVAEQFGLDAMEVTDEVFESAASVVFDEAENRLHTIKAVMVATIGN